MSIRLDGEAFWKSAETSGEVWAKAVLADLKEMPDECQTAWCELFAHCQTATGSKPRRKWILVAGKLLEEGVHRDQFKQRVLAWFPLVDKPKAEPGTEQWYKRHPLALKHEYGHNWYNRHPLAITDHHCDILIGLVWMCSLWEDGEVARALTDLAISAYKEIRGVGPRLVALGHACIWSLGAMSGLDAVSQLAVLKEKVKLGAAQSALKKALSLAAASAGMSREDIEEIAVPTYGLTEVGRLVEQMGDFTAELTIRGTREMELLWRRLDGKYSKTAPASVKSQFPEQVKELKRKQKDIGKMLPPIAKRIDETYLQEKSWSFDDWRARYLDHPLVGVVARRLIWIFSDDSKTVAGIWFNGSLVNSCGQAICFDPEKSKVRLWHPLHAENSEEIVAWRKWIEENEIRQPFKQAHREIYLLTSAEENTSVYSNRFAGHLLKQHQFNALCAIRGWKNKLRLMVDDWYPPATRLLSHWNFRAEFWIDGIGSKYGTDTTNAGTYLYLSTDQVRFYRLDAPQLVAQIGSGAYHHPSWSPHDPVEPVPLTEIPPLIFSEVMRDVDLFVGVASVGNDPAWSDRGTESRYRDYWYEYSFGELTATAKTRKEILEKLVPRLKIAKYCSFSDKFLVIAGKLRTYKIHLGSGNVLMSPNDIYLCIVGAVSTEIMAGKVFLPFEGDRVLSTILSKALLLVDDHKISDPTIAKQIGRES